MPSQALKLFYKGSKLSTVYSSSAHFTVVSANRQNLCETTSQTAQTQLLATDAQASTVTTHAENQTAIAYSPYGSDNAPANHPILSRFTGQTWVPSAIGYLLGNGHRLFNPDLMRFHSADRLSPFGKGGLNAYAYCGNDPINRTDPSGRSFIKRLGRGYSYDVLAPRLKKADPAFSANEYKALGKSLEKRNKRSMDRLNSKIDRNSAYGKMVENSLKKHNAEYTEYLELEKNTSTGRYTYSQELTQSLLGDIPIWQGPTSRLAKKLLAPPAQQSFEEISEELILEDMQERLRRLRED